MRLGRRGPETGLLTIPAAHTGTASAECATSASAVGASRPWPAGCRATTSLADSVALSASDPKGAYDLLYPGGRSALHSLGPAFGTKFPYFAGTRATAHRSLVLDQRVATTLRERAGWAGLRDWGWSAETYSSYCDLLESWRAGEHLTTAARWEFALFDPASA